MAELSTAELRQIESVNPEFQSAGFTAKLAEIQKPTITTYSTDGAITFANPYNIAKLVVTIAAA